MYGAYFEYGEKSQIAVNFPKGNGINRAIKVRNRDKIRLRHWPKGSTSSSRSRDSSVIINRVCNS